jgi:hypothetical protein
MRRRLKIPAALVVAVIAGAGCDDEKICRLYCFPEEPVPDDAGVVADAAVCPECVTEGQCPAGCIGEG